MGNYSCGGPYLTQHIYRTKTDCGAVVKAFPIINHNMAIYKVSCKGFGTQRKATEYD